MTKYIILILVILLTNTLLKAQDNLYKKDNSLIKVKIIEVGPKEIKYKLYNNLNGPDYTESRENISLIIYESGKHEVITSSAPAIAVDSPEQFALPTQKKISRADSLIYFKYANSISANFLYFLNNEFNLTYQYDFYKSNFNIIIPVGFGLEKPNITQSTYFNSNNAGASVTLTKKNLELGIGINYYPDLNSNVNYFIGPAFRYLQYGAQSNLNYMVSTGQYSYQSKNISSFTTVSRYCVSITNGIVIRTRSRLNATIFGSMGFKNDVIDTDGKLENPVTGITVNPIKTPLSFYFWCGFNIGFCF